MPRYSKKHVVLSQVQHTEQFATEDTESDGAGITKRARTETSVASCVYATESFPIAAERGDKVQIPLLMFVDRAEKVKSVEVLLDVKSPSARVVLTLNDEQAEFMRSIAGGTGKLTEADAHQRGLVTSNVCNMNATASVNWSARHGDDAVSVVDMSVWVLRASPAGDDQITISLRGTK